MLLSLTCRNDAQGFVVFHVSVLFLFACISCSLAKTNLRGGRFCYLPARSIWLGRLPSSLASGMHERHVIDKILDLTAIFKPAKVLLLLKWS